jgi:hypothetical protein
VNADKTILPDLVGVTVIAVALLSAGGIVFDPGREVALSAVSVAMPRFEVAAVVGR